MKKRFSSHLMVAAVILPLAFSSMAQTNPAPSPEWVNAEVTRLQLDRNRVTLKHEHIESIQMDPMTMPFKIKEAQLFDGYKVGDKLQIVVKNLDGELFVTQVRKQP